MVNDQWERPPNWRQAMKAAFLEEHSGNFPDHPAIPKNDMLALAARIIGVFDHSDMQIPDMSDEQERKQALFILSMAQHVAVEFHKYLKPLIEDVPADTASRFPLMVSLMYVKSQLVPGARDESDLVFVPLPASYACLLLEHLEALGHGEQDTMFQPNVTGKHSHPYAWAKAREEAILHVAYMQGGGRTKTSSRETVGQAIGVASNTLRDWEREIPDHMVKDAREAGRLEDQRINAGIPWPKTMDANVLAMADRLSGKLHGFASWYKEEFGKRHWSTVGD